MIANITTNGANWISMSVDAQRGRAGGLGEGWGNEHGGGLRRREPRR